MWEAETGKRYSMSKAHDIFSGLGLSPPPANVSSDVPQESKSELGRIEEILDENEDEKVDDNNNSKETEQVESEMTLKLKERLLRKKREEQIAKEIARAECIVETFDGVKVINKIFELRM